MDWNGAAYGHLMDSLRVWKTSGVLGTQYVCGLWFMLEVSVLNSAIQ